MPVLEQNKEVARSQASARRPDLLLCLFFISGFVGVLIEQIFERLLSTVVGGSTPAAAVVLSIYFLGLGLGAWLAARLLSRKVNPVLAYACAEMGVAVSCAVVFLSFSAAAEWFATILMWAAGNAAAMLAARGFVATLVVLPSALAMGMSFPFLSEMAGRVPDPGRYIARLYTGNLLGAAASSAFAPYAVFPTLGLSGALVLCIAADGLVAFGAMRLARTQVAVPEKPVLAGALEVRHLPVLAIAFISGFLFFALEVIWTHLVAVTVNSSVYAFSSMLFFVTLGLGLGARSASRIGPRKEPTLGGLFLVTAGLLVVQTILWPRVPMSLAVLGFNVRGFYLSESLRWLHIATLLLPVTFAYGTIYPTLFSDRRFSGAGVGSLVGYMSALNAAGCVLGALAASFMLIPLLGSEASLRAISVVLALCGIAVSGFARPTRRPSVTLSAAAVVVLLVALLPNWDLLKLTSGLNVYFRANNVLPGTKLLYFHEDCYGGVTTVVENQAKGRAVKVLLTNGKFQGDDGDQRDAQIAFTAIPALYLADRTNALVIGLGTGQTAGVLNSLGFRSIHIAELAQGIVRAADKYFDTINDHVLSSPRTTVHLEDGRNVLLSSSRKYNLISVEVTSIWFAGSTNIYSKEFYALVRARLASGGVFQQWLQLHHIGTRELEATLATVRAVFPHVSMWYFGGQGVIVATVNGQVVVPESQAAVYAYILDYFHGDTVKARAYIDRMMASRLLDERAVDRIWSSSRILNTDWNRWLEYATPRYNHSEVDWISTNLKGLRKYAGTTGF